MAVSQYTPRIGDVVTLPWVAGRCTVVSWFSFNTVLLRDSDGKLRGVFYIRDLTFVERPKTS